MRTARIVAGLSKSVELRTISAYGRCYGWKGNHLPAAAPNPCMHAVSLSFCRCLYTLDKDSAFSFDFHFTAAFRC